MELFRLLGKIAVENAEARKALQEVSQEGQKTESKLGKTFAAIGNGAVKMGKIIGTGMIAGAGAVAGLVAKSVQSYAEYEQLVGGVDTLFKESSAKVQEYAENAYKTAGMSANQYMETVTSFSASLLQSLDGDTNAAAEKADQAITDMSDNANKMGTDISMIQNAYQGFAKQNYTMLDNLKLGYGGTKEEMQRLLDDAQKISGIKYDISSYADVVDAIHVMQEEMGIAGTTAKEASTTIQGSLSSMKGAWSNLLTAMSTDDLPFDEYVTKFVDSVSTVAQNIMPRVQQALQGVVSLVDQLAPIIIEKIPGLVSTLLPALVDAATGLVNSLVAALPGVITALMDVLPMLIDGVMSIVDALVGALPQILQALLAALPTLIPQLIDAVVSLIMMLVEMLPQIIDPLIAALPTIIISIVEALVNNLPVLIEGFIQLFVGIVTALPQIIQALVDEIPTIVSLLVEAVLNNLPAIIVGLIQVVWGIVKAIPQIFNALFIELPAAVRKGIFDGLGKAFSNLGKWFGEKFKDAKEWAVNAWSDAKEKWNGIKDKCVNAFSNLKDKVKDKFSDAKKKAENAWSNAESAWQTISGKVSDGFSGLGGKLKTKFNEAKETARKAFSNAASIGLDLVKGIWNGIKDLSWIKKKIKGWVGNVTKFIKKLFGIKSPSTVMRDEVGKFLAEGVAVGIDENTEKVESSSEKMAKKVLEAAQKRLDDYKVYNDLALSEEVAFWDSVRKQVAEGTDARISADQKYLEAKKSLDDQILTAEQNLQSELDEIAKRITDRQKSIMDHFDLFSGFDASNEKRRGISNQQSLLLHLSSQVDAMEAYTRTMEGLEARIGGTALFADLKDMGFEASGNIAEIAEMTDAQLQIYAKRYDEKLALAKKMAEDDLAPETLADTQKAYETFAKTCDGLGVDINTSVSSVAGLLDSTKQAFENFKVTLGSIDFSALVAPALTSDSVVYKINSETVGSNGETSTKTTSGTLSDVCASIVEHKNLMQKLIEMLAKFFPELIEAFDVDIFINGRVLAAELAPDMDAALGRISGNRERGR